MSDLMSLSPQGASSDGSSPQRSTSPEAFLADSKPAAKNSLPPQGQSATSGLANRPKLSVAGNPKGKNERASLRRRNHLKSIQSSSGALSKHHELPRYGIMVTKLDASVKTVDLERILKPFFSRFGKVISFSFHGKLFLRYCRLSYSSELERNKALAMDGQKGPLNWRLHIQPWEILAGPVALDRQFGIKIANIGLHKAEDIVTRIKDEFKRFGVVTFIKVLGENKARYVELFYNSKQEQTAALASANSFSTQLEGLIVSPLSDFPQPRAIQNVKFQKNKAGSQVKRIPQLLPSASGNSWRDIGPRSAMSASNLSQVTDVQRQLYNTNLSPFTRSGPSMIQSSSTNLPNTFNHTMEWKGMGQPFLRGFEHGRTWSPNLNLPVANFTTVNQGQPDLLKFQYRHEHGNALSSPKPPAKPPNLYSTMENVTVQKSYGTLVRGEASASHHKASLTLWVNNLEDKTTKADLWSIFRTFGEIQHIEIREGFRNIGKQAFLQYLNLSSVYEAIEQMDGKFLGKAKLQLDFAYPHQPTNCVWLCELPTILNRSGLETIFRQFGPVVKLLHDSVKNTSLVRYNDVASAVKAVNEINTRRVFGRQVKLGFANRRCQLGFCHSMEASGQHIGDFYQLVGETSEWLLRKANIERLLTLQS